MRGLYIYMQKGLKIREIRAAVVEAEAKSPFPF